VEVATKPKLKDYQRTGVDFILSKNGRALLGDEAGAGKTRTALTAMMELQGTPALIFTINPGLFVWEDELDYWFDQKAVVYTGNAEQRSNLLAEFEENNHQFLIANYFFIDEIKDRFNFVKWKTIVTDEYHMMGIGNFKTDRFKSLAKLTKEVLYLIMVTGSPMRRNLADLFSPFKLLDPDGFRSYWRYVGKYCIVTDEGFYKTIEAIPKHPEEFIALRKKYMIRRLMKDVMPELPPKTRQVIPVYMTPEQKLLYDMMEKDKIIDYKGSLIVAPNEAVKILRQRQLLVTPHILGFDIAGGALETLAELIENEFSNGNPVAVFTPFKQKTIEPIINYLKSKLKDTLFFKLHGGMPPVKVKENYQGFQKADTIRKVFIGVIKSGMSITLTEAKVAIFIGYEWTSEENNQAEKRLHRIGTKDHVRCLYLLHKDNPVDRRVMEIINTKQHNIDWALRTEDFINV